MKRKEHGLMFMAPMIRALLNTREDVWPPVPIDSQLPFKAQTRRPGKIQGSHYTGLAAENAMHATKGTIQQATYDAFPGEGTARWAICESEHSIGTLIYAKETWSAHGALGVDGLKVYRADIADGRQPNGLGWKSSMLMPKKVARLWFEVMHVRVERVNAITDDDARLEGVKGVFYHKEGGSIEPHTEGAYRKDYERLWDSMYGTLNFRHDNPWVWAYSLRRLSAKELARLRAQE